WTHAGCWRARLAAPRLVSWPKAVGSWSVDLERMPRRCWPNEIGVLPVAPAAAVVSLAQAPSPAGAATAGSRLKAWLPFRSPARPAASRAAAAGLGLSSGQSAKDWRGG